MTLNEAYRYQNFITGIFSQLIDLLNNPHYITKTTEFHNRKSVYDAAEDERREIEKSSSIDCAVNDVIDFAMDILREREDISTAIGKAKRECETDIDRDITVNKMRHLLSDVFNSMSMQKNKEVTRNTTGYKFDNEGKQSPYYYPMTEITTIDFDRNVVKKLSRKLSREADEISSKLDLINVTKEIDFAPKYDVNDSLEDCIKVFCSN